MKLFDRFRKKEIPTKEVKSTSPYVTHQLASQAGIGSYLSPSYAYWLWQNSDSIGDAVDRIAWAFQQIDPVLRDKKTGEYIIEDHPLLQLLKNPGYRMTGDRFKYELMTSFCLTGEAYPVVDGNVKFEPAELYTIEASYAQLLEGQNNWLEAIAFTSHTKDMYQRQIIPNRNMTVYQTHTKLSETAQIMIKKARHGVRGQSPIQRIYYQAITKYNGNRHNSNILKEGTRAGGMVTPGNPLGQDQYEAFKSSFRDYQGPGNAGRWLVTNVPAEYKDFMLTPKDMDFVNLIESSKMDIYQQYQIPLPLVATKTMTMNNYSNAITAFYDLSALPRAKFLYNQLGNFLLPRYKDGDRYELVINEKQIPALKERMFERAKKMSEIYIYSDNEMRGETGYESVGEEGDVIYKPAALIGTETDDYTSDNINIDDDEE